MSTDRDTVREALDCLVDEREARGGRVADVAHAIAALDRLAAAEAALREIAACTVYGAGTAERLAGRARAALEEAPR